MPADYEIDTVRGLVLSTASGILTDADMESHVERLSRDTRFRSDYDQLQDYRSIEGLNITAACVRRIAARNPFTSGARRAMVVPDDLVYGFARMYQSLTERSEDNVAIFRDIAEARRWLGL